MFRQSPCAAAVKLPHQLTNEGQAGRNSDVNLKRFAQHWRLSHRLNHYQRGANSLLGICLLGGRPSKVDYYAVADIA